jgi:hypothetical protein
MPPLYNGYFHSAEECTEQLILDLSGTPYTILQVRKVMKPPAGPQSRGRGAQGPLIRKCLDDCECESLTVTETLFTSSDHPGILHHISRILGFRHVREKGDIPTSRGTRCESEQRPVKVSTKVTTRPISRLSTDSVNTFACPFFGCMDQGSCSALGDRLAIAPLVLWSIEIMSF